MRTIRIGAFETNSSSCHVITICSDEEFNDFSNGKLLFNCEWEKLLTFEEAYDCMKNWYNDQCGFDEVDPYRIDFENSLTLARFTDIVKSKDKLYEYNRNEAGEHFRYSEAQKLHSDWEAVSLFCRYTYRKFNEIPDWAEDTFTEHYTSKSGDKIVVFGYHGHC